MAQVHQLDGSSSRFKLMAQVHGSSSCEVQDLFVFPLQEPYQSTAGKRLAWLAWLSSLTTASVAIDSLWLPVGVNFKLALSQLCGLQKAQSTCSLVYKSTGHRSCQDSRLHLCFVPSKVSRTVKLSILGAVSVVKVTGCAHCCQQFLVLAYVPKFNS